MLVAEQFSNVGSFAVSLGAHTGIGTMPILYFGTDEQKARYLPDLATGKRLAAYALTEASSGSDALAAKTRAVLTPDGKHYLLNGTKQFITNAGFADVFTVFARVEAGRFRCGRARVCRFLGLHRRPRDAGSDGRARRAQDGHPRLVDLPADLRGRAGAGGRTCSARSARDTGSLSTSSTSAGSSSAWRRSAPASTR